MPRQAERSEKARRGLLDAALAVFNEKGYSQSSLQEVARRAGVSRALIYHHFGSKEALLLALHEELDQALLERVQGAAAVRGSPLENLIRGGREFLQATADLPAARITMLDTPAVPGLREHIEEGQREWTSLIEHELRRGIKEGSIASIDPHMTARVLVGALQQAALTVIAAVEPGKASQRAQESITRLIEGLARR